jgi:subtilisin family serine protease
MKPEIVAPGQNVISARSRSYIVPDVLLARDTNYVVNSGTSMSSPVVTGAVALYLEQHPNATVQQVREAITRSAMHDFHTAKLGGTPNGNWGYGKLDVFAMLVGVSSVPDDPASARRGIITAAAEGFPNPSRSFAVIAYSLAHPSAVDLTLYDITGERIASCAVPSQPAGAHEHRIDTDGLPSGVYRYRLQAGADAAGGTIVVTR